MKLKLPSGQRLLVIYSGVLTLVFAGTVLMGATTSTRRATFVQITVHRINVVEPDGTLRMVISDKASFPGAIFHGKEYKHARPAAGMLFYNDEGTEDGGLVYGGGKDKDGKVSNHGHLSFDNYDQDQTMVLESNQDDTDRQSMYLRIIDRPKWSLEDLFKLQASNHDLPEAKQEAAVDDFFKARPQAATRVALGRFPDKSSNLELMDQQGRKRIVMKVAADGTPVLQFLDADGKVIQQFPQASTH